MKIGKGEQAAENLMSEVEALFDMTTDQRESVMKRIEQITSEDTHDWTYEEFYDAAGLAKCRIAGQPLQAEHHADEDGNPDGGHIEGPGLSIRWQRGPLDPSDDEPWNGCFMVSVLEAARMRLEYYQETKFKCDDNEEALESIEKAIRILNRRQVERFCRGVRGKHEE